MPMSSSDGGSGTASAGAALRLAREQRGLELAAVAAMLKVPQAKLQALEADRWQDLTDMTFVRALAKAVCRTLKIDAEPVLALLPKGGERELDVSRGINKPFRERGMRDEGMSLAVLRRPLVWGPALLLLAAAGVYVLPNNVFAPAPAPVTVPAIVAAPAPADAAASQVLAPLPEPIVAAPNIAPSGAAPAVVVAAPAPTPTPAVQAAASRPAAVAPVSVSASQTAATKTAAAGDLLPLKLHIKAESWISVTDGRGQVLLYKILQPGDDPEVAGQAPLTVRIGNVAGTELSVRGSPVDLASQSKDNVARLVLN